MLALQTGDRAALAELYDRHTTRLHTFLVRWTGDAAAAEDLLHDTFVRLLAPRVAYDGRAPFRSWLYRVARNLATDRFRRLGRWVEMDESSEPISDDPTPIDDRLSPGHREVILLRTDLDMSHRELAAELGCSEGAARVRLHRALAELRRHWTQEVGHA